jgi:hypothetical protein
MHEHDDINPAWLEQALDEPPLADGGFSAATLQRIGRYRRRRRHMFVAASAATAAALASVAIAVAPRLPASPLAEPLTLVSGLVLTALCGVLWISTEPSLG